MKIAQIVPIWLRTPPVKYGGTEKIASLLTEGLVKKGHKVTLFATGDSKTKADLKYFLKKPIGITDPDVVKTLAHFSWAFNQAKDYDIIHNHGGIFGLNLAPFIKAKVITTLHNVYITPDKPYFNYLKDQGYYVSISNAQRKKQDKLNIIDTVYNAINLKEYPFYSGPRQDYILWFGNVTPDKGPDLAIKLAKKLKTKLIMSGKIDYENPHLFGFYKKYVKPHINNKSIIFYGEVSHNKKVELYQKAKCLVYPLRWEEPFGLVMTETQACGTPVVALHRGSVPEVVKNGKSGFVVGSLQDMVKAVNKISIIKPADCRRWIENNFTPERMVEGYIKVYNKVLGRK